MYNTVYLNMLHTNELLDGLDAQLLINDHITKSVQCI